MDIETGFGSGNAAAIRHDFLHLLAEAHVEHSEVRMPLGMVVNLQCSSLATGNIEVALRCTYVEDFTIDVVCQHIVATKKAAQDALGSS